MNFNLFGHADQWIAVDCGITLEQVPGALQAIGANAGPELYCYSARATRRTDCDACPRRSPRCAALSLGATAVSGLCHPLCSRRVAGKNTEPQGGAAELTD